MLVTTKLPYLTEKTAKRRQQQQQLILSDDVTWEAKDLTQLLQTTDNYRQQTTTTLGRIGSAGPPNYVMVRRAKCTKCIPTLCLSFTYKSPVEWRIALSVRVLWLSGILMRGWQFTRQSRCLNCVSGLVLSQKNVLLTGC